MQAYITEIEILDSVDDLLCRIKAFDENSFSINIEDRLVNSDELRYIADILESEWLNSEFKQVKGE